MIFPRYFLSMAAALALGVQGTAFAQQADNEIVYCLGDHELDYGTGGKNAETYDVALRLADPALVGLQVKAVRISFAQTEQLSNAHAWLTKALPAIKSSKAGEPDICKQAFDISTDDVEVVFDEPYTITAEGVYVGYSFDVAKVTGEAVRPVKTTKYTSPDGFYNNADPMEITSQFPSDVSGFPDCWLDRKGQTDAFSGNSQYGTFGIDQAWLQACSVFAPAAVEVESEWTDDETLKATAYVTFPVERADCPYELGFVLTQDGMTGTESGWTQSNYYAGEEGWPESMDQFTQGSRSIKGLVFNDVIVARSGIDGIEGSLTSPIVADVAQQYSYSFRMQDVVNTSGQNIVQDKQQLRVIALVIDTRDGSIVNANKAMAGQTSVTTGIARPALTQDETVSRVDYYDLQGRRVVMPRQGSLYIKAETAANGQVRTTKIRM